VFLSSQRARVKRDEARRIEAGEHREKARTRELAADRQAAEAEERLAKAKREVAVAEHQAEEASRTRAEAADLDQRARELDPDEDTSDSNPV
jgi:hypothetical protein